MKNKQRNGYGRFINKNGDYYIGEWLNGNYHGDGKYVHLCNGKVKEGSFENGKL